MSDEQKPREFLLTVYFDGTIPKLFFNKFVEANMFLNSEQLHVIEKKSFDEAQAEIARLKKQLSVHSHNHITRDIKEVGECPACDRHHEKRAIGILGAKLAMVVEGLKLECGNRCAEQNPCSAKETVRYIEKDLLAAGLSTDA